MSQHENSLTHLQLGQKEIRPQAAVPGTLSRETFT